MVVDEGETVIVTPVVTLMLPGVMIPVPPENVGVSVVELPDVIVDAPAVSEVAVGAATRVTVVFVEAVAPAAFVTVRV